MQKFLPFTILLVFTNKLLDCSNYRKLILLLCHIVKLILDIYPEELEVVSEC